jgi:carbonic anhydrase
MSSALDDVLAANDAYAAHFGDRADLAARPRRRMAVLTCMDARLDANKVAGLAEGDAHMIRNAGGRASEDAIRSLVISCHFLGTVEWFVIHHTDCGMESVTDDQIRDHLDAPEAAGIDWLTIDDSFGAVVEDVRLIRDHALVPAEVAIYGFLYDVHTGRLIEVPEAMSVGRPA